MNSGPPSPDAFRARRALTGVMGLAGVGLAITAAHVRFGVGLPCPLFALTGIECPFCGSTRAAASLLRLDVAEAWSYNALLVVAVPIVALLVLVWIVEALGGPVLRPPERWPRFTSARVQIAVGVVAIVFMVVRNLN